MTGRDQIELKNHSDLISLVLITIIQYWLSRLAKRVAITTE